MIKSVYVISGFIVFTLGIIGIALPALPTTPFLLLALFCFTKGSDRLHNWFCGTRIYRKYLADYVASKTMTLKQKLSIQNFANFMMISSFVMVHLWHIRLIIIICFLAHNYVFIFKIKTTKPIENNTKTKGVLSYEKKRI